MTTENQPKVIAITGAASGIGLETARLLASHGALLSLSDVQQEALNAIVEEINGKNDGRGGQKQAVGTVVDIRKRDQVEAWYAETVRHFGRLDGCANVAGVIGKHLGVLNLEDVDDEDFDFVHAVNVKGTLNCLRAQIPYLKSGASIVNVASVAGLMGFPRNAAYVSAKHAVIGLSKVAAKELGPKNIRCNSVCPGPIDTPLYRDSQTLKPKSQAPDYTKIVALGRTAAPSEVAPLIEWLLSDGASYITGASHQVDGGWIC